MARGVQNVHALARVVELQDRGGDGNTALLLNVHPVGHGVLCALLALDGTRLVDGSTVQQQLFGQRGLAGVGVADDRKRPAALDFFTICHRFISLPISSQRGLFRVLSSSHGSFSIDRPALSGALRPLRQRERRHRIRDAEEVRPSKIKQHLF